MEINYSLISILIFFYYGAQSLIFLFGILKIKNTSLSNKIEKVTVIVAARNEENNIVNCVESIFQSNYPKEYFEVIVIDDQSTDNTFEILKKLFDKYNNLKILKSPNNTVILGKSNAIDYGIKNASGDLILMTDADCVVNKHWIQSVVNNFDENVGLVAGITLQNTNSIFSGMQSLDWAFLLGIGAAGISLKNPFSVIGNNFSIRKKVYFEIGGYENLKFSVTEDFMLFKAVEEKTNWEIKFPVSSDTLVISKPCNNFKELIKQKKRWATGGLDMKLSGFSIMLAGFLMHLFFIFALFNFSIFNLLIMSSKIILDFIFLFVVLFKLNKINLLKYFIFFEIYYTIYVLILPFIVFLTGRLEWKGRKY